MSFISFSRLSRGTAGTLALGALLLAARPAAATIQATIKPSATPSAVDVYFMSNVTATYIFGNNVQVTIGIPNTTGPAPTPTGVTIAGLAVGAQPLVLTGPRPNILYNNLNMAGLTMRIDNVPALGRYTYLFNFTGISTAPVSFTAGVEVKMLTIQFQNVASGGNPNLQSLESVANGGTSGQAYFYVEGVGPGDITNSATPFYNGTDALATNGGCTDYTCSSRAVLTVNNPLPVQLTAFSAVKASDGLRSQLSWVTATETGSDYFEIERSATEGGSYSPIGVRVKAQGSSQVENTYQSYDNAPLTGLNWYRLKMVDLSGKVAYSNAKSVRFDARAAEGVVFYPNPVTRSNGGSTGIRVTAAVDQSLSYTISDAAGRMVSGGTVDVSKGTANYSIEGVEGLAAGTYYLSARGATINTTLKISKTE